MADWMLPCDAGGYTFSGIVAEGPTRGYQTGLSGFVQYTDL
jgi:hypothetical protein